MASGPSSKPQRTPPPRGPSLPREAPSVIPPAGGVWNDTLSRDAEFLQSQIDQLVRQFDLMKAQVRQAQKLASIGTTAAMIAHEFNNLLTPVVAYARQALDTEDPGLMRVALTKTLERTDVLRQMADRVVGFAKNPEASIRAVKVKSVVENAIGCLGRELAKDNIAVNLQIDPELAVRANESQLLQVFFNLVINARQAMLGRRGRLTVDAAPLALPDDQEAVQINVRDTGCGIAPEHLPRVFEAFFSTKQHEDKAERRGLGLGLCISRDIIEELGGSIAVASQPGAGTVFTITLPRAS